MKHLPLDVTQPTINHPDIHIYDGKSDLLPSFLYLQFAKYFFIIKSKWCILSKTIYKKATLNNKINLAPFPNYKSLWYLSYSYRKLDKRQN